MTTEEYSVTVSPNRNKRHDHRKPRFQYRAVPARTHALHTEHCRRYTSVRILSGNVNEKERRSLVETYKVSGIS